MSATTLTSTPVQARRTWLRRLLGADALGTGLNGLAYVAASGPIGRFLGIDPGLLLGLGAGLIAYAAAVAALAARSSPPALGVRTVVEVNLAWTVLSFVALFAWLEPSTAGMVYGSLQAVVVAAFAGLQYAALRGQPSAE
ncbi:hypothetical protein OG785_06735 [Streptomyces sp. NBC_00006]|uniref:hypothetical protein n=1 Tax=Streptomyces sp. NBC_00006 TaxID=2975619 RepID=UPI00224D8B81|nr:hypothetical protein [Streptomyces sp. NBC_00006]MCX5530251.1 hypothetical protein [Streptomyces sp. NBC_00006]